MDSVPWVFPWLISTERRFSRRLRSRHGSHQTWWIILIEAMMMKSNGITDSAALSSYPRSVGLIQVLSKFWTVGCLLCPNKSSDHPGFCITGDIFHPISSLVPYYIVALDSRNRCNIHSAIPASKTRDIDCADRSCLSAAACYVVWQRKAEKLNPLTSSLFLPAIVSNEAYFLRASGKKLRICHRYLCLDDKYKVIQWALCAAGTERFGE